MQNLFLICNVRQRTDLLSSWRQNRFMPISKAQINQETS